MFTGIIEEIGEVINIKHGAKSEVLTIKGKIVTKDSKIGDSIAVNGVCLTATDISGDIFKADVMAETMRRSSLGSLKTGSKVNLERAMLCNGRFGGHIVSGHIDGIGKIENLEKEDNAVWVSITTSSDILKFIVEKGSIAIDGISLTVAYVDDERFKVSIIPHTASETTLLSKQIGDIVNLENDIVGKYVEKLMKYSDGSNKEKKSNIDMKMLYENGFI